MSEENKEVVITIRLTLREAGKLDSTARRLGWSRSQLLRELFNRFYDAHRDPVKELQNR